MSKNIGLFGPQHNIAGQVEELSVAVTACGLFCFHAVDCPGASASLNQAICDLRPSQVRELVEWLQAKLVDVEEAYHG